MAFGVGPDWYHHHGTKVGVDEKSVSATSVAFCSNAARLEIRLAGEKWMVEWEIKFEAPNAGVWGRVYMADETLCGAFGIPRAKEDRGARHSSWLASRYRADSAVQGAYIRKGNYLNIPGPGTGHDGDPNISILLDDQIRNAVRRLIGIYSSVAQTNP